MSSDGNVKTKYFVLISLVVFAAMFILENINGRFWLNDFKVMYMAADAFLNNQQVYGVSFGLSTGYYKYSPFTLFFFIPYTFFSYKVASIIHFAVIAFCSIITIIMLERIIRKHILLNNKNTYLTLVSILLCVILHLVRELHLGNVNIILIFLYTLTLKFILEKKYIMSGILLSIIIFAKPYFIICFLPLLLFKKHNTIISTVVFGLVFLVGNCIIIGFSDGLNLYFEWFEAMLAHSGYLSSNHTIFSLLNNYFGISISGSYSLPLLGVIGFVLLFYFWWNEKRKDGEIKFFCNNTKSFIIFFFLLIAIIPNILITDTEHFLFSLPLISILVIQLNKRRNYLLIFLFLLLIFMFEGNSTDLLGKSLSMKFDYYGILGVGNLMIIGIVMLLQRSDN